MLKFKFISKKVTEIPITSGKNPNLMKKQLLIVVLVATLLKLLFMPELASAQNSRVWGTYFGGKGADYVYGLATDPSGNVFMSGITGSSNGADTNNASTHLGWHGFKDSIDINYNNYPYLVKFDASGNRLWATYYGDQGCPGDITNYTLPGDNSVATDAAGNVYLAGTTNSTTGIASQGFMNIMSGVGEAAFLAKFDGNGNRLWGTYYYGAMGTVTVANSVATDINGNVYLAGWTQSLTGIASGGFQNTLSGSTNCFLVKFDANGNRLWATYYGGNGGYDETADNGLATDAAGNVYLVGNTNSSAGIASGGFQNTSTFQAYSSAFLVKFDKDGNRLWGTYYGNTSQGSGVAADAGGNVYMTGSVGAGESDIATSGSFQDSSGSTGAFLVKFDSNCNRLWGTYYGLGSIGRDVAAKGDNVWMGGVVLRYEPNIAYDGFQDTTIENLGSSSEFLVKFDSDGNRQCATYYARDVKCTGISYNSARIAVDSGMNVYMADKTGDTSYIATPGCFQDTLGEYIYSYVWDNINHISIKTYVGNSGGDANIVKFTSCVNLPPVANFQSNISSFCANECINYTDNSTNAIAWQWSFPGATPASSTVQNPQNICYNTAGAFNASLIVSNDQGTDTLTFTNYIHVFVAPPTPLITQSNDTLFCSTDPSYTSYQWYDNTTLIPGATDTFLVITHSGNYNVAVHNESGCFISVGINIVAGIQNYTVSNLFSLSPNPASTQLTIHYSSSVISGNAVISIINVLSQTVLSNSLPFGEGRGGAVDISSLSAGMYFLQLKTESAIDTKRFIKE